MAGSNRTLRHRRGIHCNSRRFHQLFCQLTSAAERLALLSTEDMATMDATRSWENIGDPYMMLPDGMSEEGSRIVTVFNRRASIIAVEYGSNEPYYLLDFFQDIIVKYRSETEEWSSS